VTTATECLSRAHVIASEAGEGFWEATSQAELGRLAAGGGDLGEAATRLEDSRVRFVEIGHQWGLALALLSLGMVRSHQVHLAAAEQHVREALDLFETLGERGGVLGCLEGLAVIQLRQGKAGAAARLLGAIDRLRELTGFSPWGATEAELAEARSAATLALGAALFEQLARQGHAATLDEVLASLHDVPRPEMQKAPPGVEQLTPREREVAGLIAQGLTSHQIAQRLVISDKTADVHADHIRSKLGLRSRAEIAAWAVVHGLTRSTPGQ
jgi:non-specific serine/threonine protein kinase